MSQSELDEEQWIADFKEWQQTIEARINKTEPLDKCSHDWREYKGFSEEYKYCCKCDIKKGEGNEQ
jgi:hypothetical protein